MPGDSTPRRRLGRLIVLLVAPLLLSGCSDDDPESAATDLEVNVLRRSVDTTAEALVPALREETRGTVTYASGRYAPCSEGHWRYFATFTFDLPAGDDASVVAAAKSAMESVGLADVVEASPQRGTGWTSTSDRLRVWVSGREPGDIQGVRIESAECAPVPEDQRAAIESSPASDYADLR